MSVVLKNANCQSVLFCRLRELIIVMMSSIVTFLTRDGGPYRIKTSPFICSSNKWISFHMIGTSAMKELRQERSLGVPKWLYLNNLT